jgi:hypothetical protein
MWSAKNVSDILAKSNEHIDDIMHIINKQPDDDKKKPRKPSGRQPTQTFLDNCRLNTRKLSRLTTEFTGARKPIRDEAAFCAELWRNPGKFRQRYKKPDGTTGYTSGMKFRTAMGRSDFKPPKPKPSE